MKLGLAILAVIVGAILTGWFFFSKIAAAWRGNKKDEYDPKKDFI